MNSSALQFVKVIDENGEDVAFYDDIDLGITLENFRQLLIKKLAYATLANATPTFDFTFKNAPISVTQENFLTLQQVACKLESGDNRFKITLKFRNKLHCFTESSAPAKKQQYVQDNSSNSKLTASGEATTSKTGVRIFSDSEVNMPFISNFEREKRLFWNTLAAKLDKHPIYGNWTVQEKHGILDTEWTLKFTELLKVEADRHIINCGIENTQYMSLAKNLDKLVKVDFERAACYKRIENLNNVTTKDKQIVESIEAQENILHNIFSKIKSAQSDIVKCINWLNTNNQREKELQDNCHQSDIEIEDLKVEEIDEIAETTKDEDEIMIDLT